MVPDMILLSFFQDIDDVDVVEKEYTYNNNDFIKIIYSEIIKDVKAYDIKGLIKLVPELPKLILYKIFYLDPDTRYRQGNNEHLVPDTRYRQDNSEHLVPDTRYRQSIESIINYYEEVITQENVIRDRMRNLGQNPFAQIDNDILKHIKDWLEQNRSNIKSSNKCS